MKIRIYLLFFLFGYFDANGQQVDSDSLIKEIKIKITDFFIEQGILNKDSVKSSLNYIFTTEIHYKKTIGYNRTGIYKVGVLISHSPQHILIKEKSNYKILNIKGIDILLKEIIDYSFRNKIETDLMVSYIKSIILMYEEANRENTKLLNTH